MDVNDVKVAAEDLIEAGIASPHEGVCVEGIDGAERINGFDIGKVNGISRVFVFDSSGRPAVSRRVVDERNEIISELESMVLWAARRMATKRYAEYLYDDIEDLTGERYDRDWRGEQV